MERAVAAREQQRHVGAAQAGLDAGARVEASDLDLANNFDCFRVSVASPGANNDFYGIMIYLYGARYPQATPPSAIID